MALDYGMEQKHTSGSILAIDDQKDNLYVIQKLIEEELPELKVILCSTSDEGLEQSIRYLPDVILLDVQMPGVGGLELCKRLKAEIQTAHIPIVLITAHQSTPELRVQALEAGAEDFISKPIDNIELIAKIKVMMRIKRAEDLLRQRNIFLKKQVEEKTKALIDSEETNRTLLNSTSDLAILLGLNGKIMAANESISSFFGKPVAELIGLDYIKLLPPEVAELRKKKLREVMDSGLVIQFEDSIKQQVYSNSVFPVFDAQKRVERLASFSKDITAQRKEEMGRQALERQLRQAQKMESIGTLAGGIAHDFNNILFPIMGYTQMVMKYLPDEKELKGYLEEILKSTERARDLVDQILTFSRQTEEELKPLRIQPIIKEALKLLRSSLPTTIEIQREIDQNCGSVLADPTQIHQVIMNLCTNSYQAMRKEGGQLTVTLLEKKITAQDRLQNPKLNQEVYLCLTVQDTGLGMDEVTLERIFEPYFTTKKAGEGTGLGLPIVHGIVTSCEGHIQVQSTPGVGTSFTIYLPEVTDDVSFADNNVKKLMPQGKENVLVIDDEIAIVELEKEMLEKLGYTVETCTDSSKALDIFRKKAGIFDLVITDQTMPKKTGAELSHELLQIRPDIPIILLTGFSEIISEEQIKSIGIKRYLKKPMVMEEFAETVRQVLDEN